MLKINYASLKAQRMILTKYSMETKRWKDYSLYYFCTYARLYYTHNPFEWIKYRDKEFDFIRVYYFEEKQSTMWYPIADNDAMEFIKKRALELKNYYNMYEF